MKMQQTKATNGDQAKTDSPPPNANHTNANHTNVSHTHANDGASHTNDGASHTNDHTHGNDDHDHTHTLFGHSHHHQHNELLSTSLESIKSNPGVRITWIGLFVNVGMAISKGLGGVYFHSQALVADAIHSISDMIADFLTLATVNVSNKVGNATNFPLGYGKVETVGSLLVSSILLFAGISVGWTSLLQVFEYTLPTYIFEVISQVQIGHGHSHSFGEETHQDNSHSHSHTETVREVPNINAAWLAGGSIVIKELLFRKTMKIALETNSKVLIANAWHHRIDSMTAFVALLTVTGGVLFNIAWLDSIGGIAVSILIIKAGWGSFKTAWNEMIDRGEKPGMETYDRVNEIVETELSSNSDLSEFQMKRLSVLTSGANTNVYLWLSTLENKQYSLKQLNLVENKLKYLIKRDDHFIKKIFIRWTDEGVVDYDSDSTTIQGFEDLIEKKHDK